MPTLQSVRRKLASIKKTKKDHQSHEDGRGGETQAHAGPDSRREALRAEDAGCDPQSQPARQSRGAPPPLRKREGNRIVVAIVTSDRRLCGAFNANIVRTAVAAVTEFQSQGAQVEVAVIGRKGQDFSGDAAGRYAERSWISSTS